MIPKTWQYLAIVSEEAFLSTAVVHLGYLGLVFVMAYDRKTGERKDFEALTPLGVGMYVPLIPEAEAATAWLPQGIVRIDSGARTMRMSLPKLTAEAICASSQPWDAYWKIGMFGYDRTAKHAGFKTQGFLKMGDRHLSLNGHGVLDWTRAVMARETSWRWSAGMGRAGDRLIAWNLRQGLSDPDEVENAIWIDGVPHAAGHCKLEPGETWKVGAWDLDLAFTPDGERTQNLDMLLLASRYRQPFGRFHGTFEGMPLEGYGVVEDHWARW